MVLTIDTESDRGPTNRDQRNFFQTVPRNPMGAPPPHLPHWKKYTQSENLELEPIGYIDSGPEGARIFPWFVALRRIYSSKPSAVQSFEKLNLGQPSKSLPSPTRKGAEMTQILLRQSTIPVVPELREFMEYRTFMAQSREILGKLKWVGLPALPQFQLYPQASFPEHTYWQHKEGNCEGTWEKVWCGQQKALREGILVRTPLAERPLLYQA